MGNYYPTIPSSGDTLAWMSNLPIAESNFAIHSVFGGSDQTDYTPKQGKQALVHVYQCSENTIYEVFGGSNSANVGRPASDFVSPETPYTTDANVIIDGGRI